MGRRSTEEMERHRVEEAARRAADPQAHLDAAARYRTSHPKSRGGGKTGRVTRTQAEVLHDIARGKKVCKKCGEDKPMSEFHANPAFADGKSSKCKTCTLDNVADYRKRMQENGTWTAARRAVSLKHKYNLTPEQYDDLYDKQLGRCPGCLAPLAEVQVCVDHDHSCCPGVRSCGRCVRGLLCLSCNSTLGYAKDDPQVLLRLASYITGD